MAPPSDVGILFASVPKEAARSPRLPAIPKIKSPRFRKIVSALKLSQTQVDELLFARNAPKGYTWHHHQDVGRMQLIKSDAHELSLPHTGGMAIWGGGY
ncbi:MAG: HNH endonuclease [Myxococcaceae bacterium]|nr:HNH endonuclease [Myxococcaceae bacterium]